MKRTDYVYTGWCRTHGKLSHPTRKAARRAAKAAHGRMRAYPCDVGTGMWHVGHLAPEVVAGRTTMHEVRARRAAG